MEVADVLVGDDVDEDADGGAPKVEDSPCLG